MPPGPKKRRARKQQQEKQQQLLQQQQQQLQQQQKQKAEKKNEEVREEGEEEDEDEEIPSPDRQHQKRLHLQEMVNEEKEPAMVDDGDVNLSPQPEETMEACENVSVEEAKKDDNLSFRPKETLVADNYFAADDASKIDHKEEEKQETMEGQGDEDLNIRKVEQFDQKEEERLVEDDMEARDIHDAESKLDQKEEEEVVKAQDIGDVGELMKEGQKGEEEKFKAQELSEVNANVDKHSSGSVQADEDSEIKLIHVSEIEITAASSASGDDINLNQSNGESNAAGVFSVQEPKIMVVPLLEAEAEVDSEPYSVVMSKPEAELVSEQQAVTVSEAKVVVFTETEVDAASKPEAEVVSESKQEAFVVSEPETIVGFEPEAVILNLQKDSKSTVVETVNMVDIKQQPDSESSMELKSLPDLEVITKVDKSAQEKTEQPCEPDQQEATEDIVENPTKEESKLNHPSEPSKQETEDTSKVSVTEESPTKAEGETTGLVFPVADESSEISYNVREIPSSSIELKSSLLAYQEYQVREEVALSHLHHVEQENDWKTSSTFERSEKAIESEDGLVDEPSMSEHDREDDAASSLIVEVGSVYAESDLQELEDSGNPPIGMEVGSSDNQDFTSRPGSPNMNDMCLEEQDNGETSYVEQQYFSEENAEIPQENFEAEDMVVKDLAEPNGTENIMAYDVSVTANPHKSSPVHVNDYYKLEETKYTILENGGHKDENSLKIGHRNNNGVSDGADVDIALDNANKRGEELGDKKLILPTVRNEEEVKIEVKEANISYGKWKQAAILPEESIEAWDEKREIVNTVITPAVSSDHPFPTGSLKGEEDSGGEKAAIEFTKEESHLTVVPNHKERSTTEYVKETNARQSDGAGMMTRRSNWFGCCGMLDLLMSKDR